MLTAPAAYSHPDNLRVRLVTAIICDELAPKKTS